MPEIHPYHAPDPIAVIGWDGAAYRVFALDATGHLNVNVLTNLGLDDALQSVATDRLQVRGEDQLHSFHAVLANIRTAAISGAGGYVESQAVPPGEIWVVTNIAAVDATSATTEHAYYIRHSAANFNLDYQTAALAAARYSFFHGWLWLMEDDTIRVYFTGGQVADSCAVRLLGHIMSQE